MVRNTPSSQDASTHQIWNSYLKEYRRYAPDTKRDGRTHGRTHGRTYRRTVRLLYASQSSFGSIKNAATEVILDIRTERFLAILNLCVSKIALIKFQFNLTYCSRGAVWRFLNIAAMEAILNIQTMNFF